MQGGLYYCSEQLIGYRLHDRNVIGMPQGEHVQRHVSFFRRLYLWALAFKYSFLEENGEACRAGLMSVTMDKYEFVFDHAACGAEELAQREAWKAFQSRRLQLIEKKRLLTYLIFFLKNHRLFAENAYFATDEQVAIRVMLDLCAMLK